MSKESPEGEQRCPKCGAEVYLILRGHAHCEECNWTGLATECEVTTNDRP